LPASWGKLNSDFIRGMGKHNDKFIILLNIDAIFSQEQLLATDKEETI
jgi:chemotaxis signal transduction protein